MDHARPLIAFVEEQTHDAETVPDKLRRANFILSVSAS